MNTQDTYLRFAETTNGEEVKPVFVSIADLLYVGNPFDANSGEDLVADLELYKFNGGNKYEKIA